MNRKCLCLMVGAVICLATGNVRGADPWKSAQALPKEPNTLTLRGNATRPGNEIAGQAFQIVWPARVQKVDGQWILIGDTGGYSVPPVKGWVRKDDMICIRDDGESTGEDPSQYLSSKMLEATDPAVLAGLLWLRGIYWESQQESEVAARDYSASIRSAFGQKVDPSLAIDAVLDLFRPDQNPDAAREAMTRFPGLADAYLRLAKLSTKSADKNLTAPAPSGSATAQPGAAEPWKTYFSCADYLFRSRSASDGLASRVPALDTDWADALAAEYDRLSGERNAASKAKTSNVSSKSSAAGPQAGPAAQTQEANEIDATATRADALYQSALSVNRSWSAALLGRGKLLIAKAKALGAAKGTKPSQQSQALITEAAQQYSLAIQLNPKSKPAFRGRAEAYQLLAGHPQLRKRYQDRCRCLSQAAQSADTASQLGRDRDPACLELLAQVIENEGEIYKELKAPKNAATFFKQASYYWQEAAGCPNADRARILEMATACRQKIGQQQTLIAESSRGEETAPEPQLPFYVPGSNLFGDKNKE